MEILPLYRLILLLLLQTFAKGYCDENVTWNVFNETKIPSLTTSTIAPSATTDDLPEVDLEVQPGWWFPPVQFEHVIAPDESKEDTLIPGSMILGGDISFVPLIISKDPPHNPLGTIFGALIPANTTFEEMKGENGTVFPLTSEISDNVTNSNTTQDTDISFIVYPAEDITGEILLPQLVVLEEVITTTEINTVNRTEEMSSVNATQVEVTTVPVTDSSSFRTTTPRMPI